MRFTLLIDRGGLYEAPRIVLVPSRGRRPLYVRVVWRPGVETRVYPGSAPFSIEGKPSRA